jgi:hypothetical protein
MVHQQPHRSTFVEIRARLLKERIDGEFQVELLDLERGERFG